MSDKYIILIFKKTQCKFAYHEPDPTLVSNMLMPNEAQTTIYCDLVTKIQKSY